MLARGLLFREAMRKAADGNISEFALIRIWGVMFAYSRAIDNGRLKHVQRSDCAAMSS